MTQLRFTKMHGIGNDFVVIDGINQTVNYAQLPIAVLSNRYTGIGFDQLLIIEPSLKADFFCRIFNADGSEAEQCGNGLRCVARFLHENGLIKTNSFSIETKAGIFPITIKDYERVRVGMGVPHIMQSLVQIHVDESAQMEVSMLSLGNPHAVLKVADVQKINTASLGPAISSHAYFPRGANVGFMEILQKNHIRLRTFERGAGETLACGSNACAAVVAGIANEWLAPLVQVDFSQGSLWVEWEGASQSVYLTGPATRVFTGELDNRYK